MDKTTAPFFYENGISFNIADSSSFVHMIENSMRFSKKNPFQSYKAPSHKQLSRELLDPTYRSNEQLQFLLLLKSLDLLTISEH